MSGITNADAILRHYSTALMPIYEDVCGDTGTYSQVQGAFRKFLKDGADKYYTAGGSNDLGDYAFVSNLSANNAMAARVFRDFLDGGRNCHEKSPVGEAMSISQAIESAAIAAKNAEFYAARPSKLSVVWHQFVGQYFSWISETMKQIEAATKANGTIRNVHSEIWGVANRADRFAAAIDERLHDFSDLLDATLEGRIIKAQMERFNLFRAATRKITPTSSTEASNTPFTTRDVEVFRREFEILQNPFDWIHKVLLKYERTALPHVEIDALQIGPALKSDSLKITSYWELLDWIVMMTASRANDDRPGRITFELDDSQNQLVITMPYIRTRSWSSVDRLVRFLAGSRMIKGHKDDDSTPVTEIRLPLRAAGALATPSGTQNSPPPAASQSGNMQGNSSPAAGSVPMQGAITGFADSGETHLLTPDRTVPSFTRGSADAFGILYDISIAHQLSASWFMMQTQGQSPLLFNGMTPPVQTMLPR